MSLYELHGHIHGQSTEKGHLNSSVTPKSLGSMFHDHESWMNRGAQALLLFLIGP